MTLRLFFGLFLALTGLFTVSISGVQAADRPVTLFAAASTTDAVNEIAEAFAAQTGGSIRPVVAASSTLARQIAQGAPADLFLSASGAWVDHLAEQRLIVAESQTALLANRLVLVAPADSPLRLQLLPGASLDAALGDGRLAIGDPAHVPAGIYARQALEALGLWDQVADRLAQASNVRAALALVGRGEAVAGIVYKTDAAIARNVKVLDVFPADTTPPITYPLAIVTGRDSVAVRAVYNFLKSDEAAAIFRKHGFTSPVPES
ncbi:molybdate ABC transporter substrate-binding protein [Pelagibius litoralis]|uniref:Molybdate ABC transporter substrate-binding protein n=1 Tax=Pelagibius litoralis TaxID=374515 RepID=A0A967CA79_9PROT|nr:molybdate ABC transporter substrate-binding protein [Pelagibius litoralis]NIA67184.1 molybdate ABC transporter substrate-binding protein [Pelagibius litoralis]